jgi:hypothetical protein
METKHTRILFYLWALVACPLIGAIACIGTRSVSTIPEFVFIAGVFPAALAAAVAGFTRKPTVDVVVGTVGAGLVGGFGTFAFLLWALLRSGVLD